MTGKAIKNISIALIFFATVLLILDIIQLKRIDTTEKGLWNFMPHTLQAAIPIAYPLSLLTSYVLFIFNTKVKTKFDSTAYILFLLNGLIILILFAIFLTELVKHL